MLLGNAGADHLNGGNGRNILIGSVGQDRLVGGGDDDCRRERRSADGSSSHLDGQ